MTIWEIENSLSNIFEYKKASLYLFFNQKKNKGVEMLLEFKKTCTLLELWKNFINPVSQRELLS